MIQTKFKVTPSFSFMDKRISMESNATFFNPYIPELAFAYDPSIDEQVENYNNKIHRKLFEGDIKYITFEIDKLKEFYDYTKDFNIPKYYTEGFILSGITEFSIIRNLKFWVYIFSWSR